MDQKLIRSYVGRAYKCQLYVVRITFDPFAKRMKRGTVNCISFDPDF